MPLRARKSDNYPYCDSWKSDIYRKVNKAKKQRNYTKSEAKSNNSTRSNRGKSNIAFAL